MILVSPFAPLDGVGAPPEKVIKSKSVSIETDTLLSCAVSIIIFNKSEKVNNTSANG